MKENQFEEFEKFAVPVISQNGVLRISIPKRIAQYAGYQQGDYVKVFMKKIFVPEKEDENGQQSDT